MANAIEYELEIRKIKTTALLNQLLTSDKVLKNAPPEDVIDAFNLLMKVRSDLTDHPVLVRGLLRVLVEQQTISSEFPGCLSDRLSVRIERRL